MSEITGTLNSTQRMDTTAAIAVALTVVGWASAFPAIRAGLAAFGPLELGALRFAIAAVPAAIFLAVKRPALPRLDPAVGMAGDQRKGFRRAQMQPVSLDRQRDAARTTVEDFQSQPVLELGDLPADGAMGDIELFGGR